MLNKILNNLKMYPEDECYEINDKVYINMFVIYITIY